MTSKIRKADELVEEETVLLASNTTSAPDTQKSKEARGDSNETVSKPIHDDVEMGEFEDAFEDELECEDVIDNGSSDDGSDGSNDSDVGMADLDQQEAAQMDEKKPDTRAYLPGDQMDEGEVLDYDPSAYRLFHSMNVEWPCLSFDILKDPLGDRDTLPATVYLAAGTQADNWANNKLLLMKMSRLHKMRQRDDEDEEEEDSDTDDIDEDPILEHAEIKHHGGVNRVRVMPHDEAHIISTWAETGKVHIWDCTNIVKSFDTPGLTNASRKISPVCTVGQHNSEGYAMDWSRRTAGRLVSGDCKGKIVLTERRENSGWLPNSGSYSGHGDSVEDLQWSPNEDDVFASCSVDKTIKIWDTRLKTRHGLEIVAHECDVNVISWNGLVPYLLASGADDGSFKIWDLRNCKDNSPSAAFTWHKKAITSIEWHPTDEAQLAVSGEDDQIT
eukprot:Partr_v1_DN24930_c0_g1_i1_m45492 putative Glutamate-rich wd repeat-containing protein